MSWDPTEMFTSDRYSEHPDHVRPERSRTLAEISADASVDMERAYQRTLVQIEEFQALLHELGINWVIAVTENWHQKWGGRVHKVSVFGGEDPTNIWTRKPLVWNCRGNQLKAEVMRLVVVEAESRGDLAMARRVLGIPEVTPLPTLRDLIGSILEPAGEPAQWFVREWNDQGIRYELFQRNIWINSQIPPQQTLLGNLPIREFFRETRGLLHDLPDEVLDCLDEGKQVSYQEKQEQKKYLGDLEYVLSHTTSPESRAMLSAVIAELKRAASPRKH